MTDLENARKIVSTYKTLVGSIGTLRENVAQAVAEGIAIGRREGLELAAKAVAEASESLGKSPK